MTVTSPTAPLPGVCISSSSYPSGTTVLIPTDRLDLAPIASKKFKQISNTFYFARAFFRTVHGGVWSTTN